MVIPGIELLTSRVLLERGLVERKDGWMLVQAKVYNVGKD